MCPSSIAFYIVTWAVFKTPALPLSENRAHINPLVSPHFTQILIEEPFTVRGNMFQTLDHEDSHG